MSDTQTSYQIRCLHLDPERPSEDVLEFHWRCRSKFSYDTQLEPWQRNFCPYHRHLYHPSDHVITREEAQALNATLARLDEGVTMPDVTLNGESMTAEERAWAEARKRELKNQAIAAGLLQEETP